MQCKKIVFSGHAITRMFERGVTKQEVVSVIHYGEIIFEYPDDQPYPSKLLLSFVDKNALHIVVSHNIKNNFCYIVTAYKPSKSLWHDDYKTRRK